MPKPSEIKAHNTMVVVEMIEKACNQLGVGIATRAGAGITLYINGMLDAAANQGIDVTRRSLDHAIALLTAMRAAPHAEAMKETAERLAREHNAQVLKRTDAV